MKRSTRVVIFLAIYVFLQAVFLSNGFGQDPYPDVWQDNGEYKILGRLALTRQEGAFSRAGLLGWCEGKENFINWYVQFNAYQTGTCENYAVYDSQSGVQAMLYAGLDALQGNYDTFRIVAATFLSVALALLFFWMLAQFGVVAALLTLACVPFLRWLVLTGDNIALLFGVTLFIPVVMAYVHERNVRYVGTAAYVVFLLKLLLNGAEYFVLAAILAFVPLAYYAVLRSMGRHELLRTALRICLGISLAGMTAVAILFAQIAIDDSAQGALGHIGDRMLARTYFPVNSPLNQPYYYDAMQIGIAQVVVNYLWIDAIRIGGVHIPFWMLIVLFLAVTPVTVILARKRGDRKLLALVCAVWACFMGPLGWIVLIKGHSATHWFIDPVVFDLPFTILGFLLVFATAKALVRPASPGHNETQTHKSDAAAHSLVHDNKL